MPTTSYVAASTSVRGIGARTNAAGAAVDDISAEEDRIIHAILSEGAIGANAFKVSASSGMDVTVGSGAAKVDRYVVAGEIAGQENYIVRLDATSVTVTVPAADASLARIDEVYLIVADAPYDGGSVSLPRIGFRKGDAGGSAPGPDSAWKASVKLATIAVGAAVTSIVGGNITDNRGLSAVSLPVTAAQLAAIALGDLSDVTSTVAGTGDFLRWNGTAWAPGGLSVAVATRTSGDVTVNSASPAVVDAGMDLTIAAKTGDIIGLNVLGEWGPEAFFGTLYVHTRVSGADLNQAAFTRSWIGDPSVDTPISGEYSYTVVSGDVVGGTVTFRLNATAAAAKTLQATASFPLQFRAVNYG